MYEKYMIEDEYNILLVREEYNRVRNCQWIVEREQDHPMVINGIYYVLLV